MRAETSLSVAGQVEPEAAELGLEVEGEVSGFAVERKHGVGVPVACSAGVAGVRAGDADQISVGPREFRVAAR